MNIATENINSYFGCHLDESGNIFELKNIAEDIIKKSKNYSQYSHSIIELEDVIGDLQQLWLENHCENKQDFYSILQPYKKELINKYRKYTNTNLAIDNFENTEDELFSTTNTPEDNLISNNDTNNTKDEGESIEQVEETTWERLHNMTEREAEVWYYAKEYVEKIENGEITEKKTQTNIAKYVSIKTGKPIKRQSLSLIFKRAAKKANIDISTTGLAGKKKKSGTKKKTNIIPMPNIQQYIKQHPEIYNKPKTSYQNNQYVSKAIVFEVIGKKTANINHYDSNIIYNNAFNSSANELNATANCKKNSNNNIPPVTIKINHQSQNDYENSQRKTGILKIKYSPATIKANTTVNVNTVTDTNAHTNTGTIINFTSFATNKAFNTSIRTHRYSASMRNYKYLNTKSEVTMTRAGPF